MNPEDHKKSPEYDAGHQTHDTCFRSHQSNAAVKNCSSVPAIVWHRKQSSFLGPPLSTVFVLQCTGEVREIMELSGWSFVPAPAPFLASKNLGQCSGIGTSINKGRHIEHKHTHTHPPAHTCVCVCACASIYICYSPKT